MKNEVIAIAKYQKLSVKGLALSLGILWGAYMFLAAIFAQIGLNIFWLGPEAFEILMAVYPGISATVIGSALALIYGFACGAICGGLFAWIYNKFV